MMSFFSAHPPRSVQQLVTFVLRPSEYEEDPAFRETLTQVVHAGLRWGGIAALLGLVVYVGVEIVVLGRPVWWFHRPEFPGEGVALVDDLLLIFLCIGSAVLPATKCSLNRCRAWAAGGLLIGAGVFLRSDMIQGTVEIEFVALLYLLVVVAVPFRPWHVVGLGVGIEIVLVVLGIGGMFVPEPAAETVQISRFALGLGFATVLATLVSTVLYATRLAQHRERREAQETLRRSRDLLRRTQKVAGVGGWEYDPDTDTLRGTEQTVELLNLPADGDWTLNAFVQAFDADACTALRAALRRCHTQGEPFDLELPRTTADGRRQWVRTRGEVRPKEEPVPNAFQMAGTVQDVTEERELEEQLRERELWLRSITENVPDGICRSDPEEGLVYANQAFAQMFGYESPAEIRDVDPADLYANPDVQEKITRHEEHSSDAGGVEVELQRKDGTTFPGLLNRTKVLDEEGEVQYYDAIVTDITDQKEREQRLIAAKEEAEEASRLKSAMLANMSHEIRTPLTAINGFAEILEEEVVGHYADLARRILRSGERLLQTLTSLVQLSKLEAGVADLDRESVQLDRAVEETVEMLRPRAEERSMSVETEVSDPPIEGAWNEGAVDRILTNLLDNAIKFTPEGGQIRVYATETTEEGVLVVEDTGIGMSEPFQEVAFDAFKQESEGIDRAYEGAGLGLSIVQRLVQALDGTIELDSKKGKGTRCTVRLPRTQVPEEEAQASPVLHDNPPQL